MTCESCGAHLEVALLPDKSLVGSLFAMRGFLLAFRGANIANNDELRDLLKK